VADEINPAAPGAAVPIPAAAPVEPAKVDPTAAALALFKKDGPAQDPKALAPSASSPGGNEAGKADETAPGTAEPAAADPALAEQRAQLSRGFAKLASQKAAVQAQQERIKAADRWEQGTAKVKESPSYVLELHGISLEQVAEDYLKRTAGAAPASVEDRVAQLEADRKAAAERATKDAETAQARAQQEARETGVKVIQAHLEAQADKFPVTLAKAEVPHVMDALSGYLAKHQIPYENVTMDMVTAVAMAYEEARQAQVDEEFSALAPKVPKLAARFAPPKPPEATAPAGETRQGAQASSVTLVGNSGEAPPPQPSGRLSKAELERRALEVFKKASPAA
jgi:hypothetical protein